MLAFILITAGIILRLVTHEPNFTPVIAIALFAGTYLNKRFAFLLPLAIMVLSDCLIGFHDTIAFTWGSLTAISLLGVWLSRHKSFLNIALGSIASSLIFFVVTNFGVWIVGTLYPVTLSGLTECFLAAIPFYRSTFLSAVFYGAVLFGIYEIVALRVRGTPLARVLLTV